MDTSGHSAVSRTPVLSGRRRKHSPDRRVDVLVLEAPRRGSEYGGYRIALLPVWFFAIGAIVNGIAHPMLAVVSQGYFPGSITSPVVGVLGVLLWVRLQVLTTSSA